MKLQKTIASRHNADHDVSVNHEDILIEDVVCCPNDEEIQVQYKVHGSDDVYFHPVIVAGVELFFN